MSNKPDNSFSLVLKIDYIDDPENPLTTMSNPELRKLAGTSHNPMGPLWRASVASCKNSKGEELFKDAVLEWDMEKKNGGFVSLMNQLKIMIPRVIMANGLRFNG